MRRLHHTMIICVYQHRSQVRLSEFVHKFLLTAAACALFSGIGSSCVREAAAPVTLTVSAAISLKGALEEIKALFHNEHPALGVTYNFGASGMLRQQIESGAPVDLFIPAAARHLDALAGHDLLLEGSRTELASNTLVLIAAATAPPELRSLSDLAHPAIHRIAIGEPKSVPAGEAAHEALVRLGMWERLSSKFIYAKDVRQVLAYVESGNVDAGFVYRTDAAGHASARLVAAIPESLHSPIRYPAAIIGATRHRREARLFLAFLSSARARAIFAQHGFIVAPAS